MAQQPPTKSALLNLKRQVAFLQEGHDLLERKRELLTRLVYEHLTHYRQLRREAHAALDDSYYWLSITHMRMSSRQLRQAAQGIHPGLSVKILPRSSLGVEYPAVTVERQPLQPISLLWTDASLDETRSKLVELAMVLARLGEAETSLRRMVAEQRKTQKRVNALKYNVIPRYQAAVRYIQSALEEEERNALFQIKVLQEQGKKGR
ncbi:H+-transporting two-sector ATPase, D subunit [Nitrosococcus oceani ATCC 19707]|uniref:V-type ATP synthase subunit D n=2 Tax=Nitrosococcus oceani TaxID=1229 RepID=Q3J9F5_NITOC|nr:V-type ATP synthase subunit D [Nitrosococcus oceani]ABA58541.1 H+-transporting two-sector ATPase, D subunit [Nitrosococcus oceani ATCC 19707]EDZ67982.1 V-type ATPase, D subunit [Nitrosococcus oceani AFC27]KFI19024.1 ATPase [Nitrosococcus oceani C-27]GEM19660.1 V-type ATP synthase subunit D [Nitrosococcus oceani]